MKTIIFYLSIICLFSFATSCETDTIDEITQTEIAITEDNVNESLNAFIDGYENIAARYDSNNLSLFHQVGLEMRNKYKKLTNDDIVVLGKNLYYLSTKGKEDLFAKAMLGDKKLSETQEFSDMMKIAMTLSK